ncbi:alkaline-phosphatase-like, core domain containing protein [Nitzschia inconspicua]|uniref:Alkaline-phosphatase-like, core domain containing protein n=1 Tax=Nitzschia inconspicua TaxID=303405 RepID=A0A9K3KVW4_9STRA|nr:alkaline-phosphatase-like, core domain containing protein [Nitzschia inconspicua]
MMTTSRTKYPNTQGWFTLLGSFLLFSVVSNAIPTTSGNGSKKDDFFVPTDRPNFILLFMDDLGYGDMGFTGHPTTHTPNLDRLAWNGMMLTTWYSACAACTGSRAGLMTGRQWPRTGLPWVLGPVDRGGLNLNETTIAEHLKQAGYSTAIVGKWHLGARHMFLPANRGFDSYLGIPYSDDMGDAIASDCPAKNSGYEHEIPNSDETTINNHVHSASSNREQWIEKYRKMGISNGVVDFDESGDQAQYHLPLVHQENNKTTVLEQPLDFTTLAQKYNDFATNFIRQQAGSDDPFFLYVPFSHVHITSPSQNECQYAGCDFRNSTKRGKFGDALAEADWIVGNIHQSLQETNLEHNTLILFTSDNGPWLSRGLSAGSAGVFTGRYAGYYDTGKATTWEGGIRMPAFAYWSGTIKPHSRSSEIVSSLDVFPTFSALAGLPLPADRPYDGKDLTPVLLGGPSKHKENFLFFYGVCHIDEPYYTVTAVRHGKYKAHWCTAPGLHGGENQTYVKVYDKYPLLFDVEKDPSESEPLSSGGMPKDPEHQAAMDRIVKAYAMERATFVFGSLVTYPDEPGEGPAKYGVCCDRSKGCYCPKQDGRMNKPKDAPLTGSFMDISTKAHHDAYHDHLGEEEPSPPKTRVQRFLQQQQQLVQ